MKNVLIASVALALMSTTAMAERIQGTVVDMQERYSNVMKNVPVESCNVVEVPVYKEITTGQASTGDALAGAIIGGVIGNQFGKGSGKDAATVLGAIIGADRANKTGGKKETVIVGYRQQQQCTTTYQQKEVKQRGRNVVTVRSDSGQEFMFKTNGWYARGTIVFMDVTLTN